MVLIITTPPVYYDPKQYGCKLDGTTNDATNLTATITAASAAGGGIVILSGMAGISSPITLPTKVQLMGAGPGTGLKALAGFSGAQMVLINADYAGVSNLELLGGTHTTSSLNPATNGVQITGARWVKVLDLECYYINGWAIQSSGTASQSNYGAMLDRIHIYHCKNGIHTIADTAQGFGVQHFMSNINAEIIDSGDGIFLEDSEDVWLSNINGAVDGSGAGSMIHIKGHSSSVYGVNVDIGVFPGPATQPTVLIETGANGDPSQIGFVNCIFQAGNTGLTITAGSQINFARCKFFNNNTHGVSITGGTLAEFEGCIYQNNGQTAGAGHYDVNITISSGTTYQKNCIFDTAIGAGSGQVSNSVNDTNHSSVFEGNDFYTCSSSSQVFAGTPHLVRNCKNYNPVGSITAPTIGASPFTSSQKQDDCTVYVTGGTVSAVAIGGVSTGLTSGTFRVPARQTITLTYTVSPSWVWIAD